MNLSELSYNEKVQLLLSEKKKALVPSSDLRFVIARARRIIELEKLIMLDAPTLSKNVDGGTPETDHTSIDPIDGGTII